MTPITIPDLGTTLPPESVMIKYFGPIADPVHETIIDFAGHPVTINDVLANNLRAAGKAIKAAGLAGEIHDVGGFRLGVGASGSPIPYSMHQFGAAIDINEASQNWHTMTMDPQIVQIMSSFGWYWGGNWSGVSYDGGHFQFMGGTVVTGSIPQPVAGGTWWIVWTMPIGSRVPPAGANQGATIVQAADETAAKAKISPTLAVISVTGGFATKADAQAYLTSTRATQNSQRNVYASAPGWLSSVTGFLGRLGQASLWIRVGEVVLGIALIIAGAAQMSGLGKVAVQAGKIAATTGMV